MKLQFKLHKNLLVKPIIGLIYLYQCISSSILSGSCRHTPTCSQYTIDALRLHGIKIGIWLSIIRLIRCNPWGSSGNDPVPRRSYATELNANDVQ